jgi:[ribosomal protein S18]-alanine N-acetyltransferase
LRSLDIQRHLTPAIHIVRFNRRHLDRILQIEQASFGAGAWPRESFLDLESECGALFFVARLRRRIAGYSATCVRARRAEIVSLAVHPDYRRRGVAGALLRRTLRDLRAAGIPRVTLMVRTANTAGVELYRSFGFRLVRTVRRYYEDGGDGFLMVRAIQ